jgi:hypothetical protein
MNHPTLQQPTMLIPKCKSCLLFKEALLLDLRCFAFTLKNVAKYLKTTSFGYMSHMWNFKNINGTTPKSYGGTLLETLKTSNWNKPWD